MSDSQEAKTGLSTGNKIAIAGVVVALLALLLPYVLPGKPDCDALDSDALAYHKQHRGSVDTAIERALVHKFEKFAKSCGANANVGAILEDWHSAPGRCNASMGRGKEVCTLTEETLALLLPE